MWQSFIVSMREGLEISFFLGLMIIYLKQIGKQGYIRYLYAGAVTGFFVILVGGFTVFDILQGMGEAAREVFLGYMALFIALVVAYFVVWMKKESDSQSDKVKKAVKSNIKASGMFAIAFLTVFREGMEIVAFNLSMIDMSMIKVVFVTIAGLVTALTCNYLLFRTTVSFNLDWLFKILSLMLIIVGARMFGEGLAEFIPGGILLQYGATVLYAVVCIIYYLKGKVIGNK